MRTGNYGADTKQQADQRGRLYVRQFLSNPGKMPADDVASFVSQNTDDLIWRGRLRQGAHIDKNAVRIHHKSVEAFVIDDDDVNILIGQASNAKDRRRVVAQQLFDLGVAYHRNAGTGAGLRPRRQARQSDSRGGQRGDGLHSWPPPPRLARRLSNHHVTLNRAVSAANYGTKRVGTTPALAISANNAQP